MHLVSTRMRRFFVVALLTTVSAPNLAHAKEPADVLLFGDLQSEAAHELKSNQSDIISGGLGVPARRLLPLQSAQSNSTEWRGGSVSFKLNVLGDTQNYLTVRLWGSDENKNQTTLFCDGKQVGYRHGSDLDILDQGTNGKVAPGQFHYVTHPLPLALTKGKSKIECEMRASGPIWRYGGNFERFQRPMTTPTRGFYALIVHSEKLFQLDVSDGKAPELTVRPKDQDDVLSRVKNRVNGQLEKLWSMKRPPHQLEIIFLAKTHETKWSKGYGKHENIAAILQGADNYYKLFQKNPDIALNDPNTPNPGWFGLGLLGEALKMLSDDIQGELDQPLVDDTGMQRTRRAAYESMFLYSLNWNKKNRRMFTNQSMIKDLYGIWYNNEGLIAIGSAKAESRQKLLPFLYESVGLLPWTGSLNDKGAPTYAASEDDAKFAVPKDYYLVTKAGLTKELGYVGGYGEVLDWVGAIYDATRPGPDKAGDEKIRNQLVKLALTRTYFRIPAADDEGFKSMRLETGIGWRDINYPGDVMYGQKPSWDASPLQVAVSTGDPTLMSYAKQQLADNQLLSSIEHMLKTNNIRATIGLIGVVDEYDALKRSPVTPKALPMAKDQPDFVFFDAENAVVALKNGGDILYASLYWRANYGINGLGRVHYVTPQTDRMATVVLDRQEYDRSDFSFTRPNNPHINGTRFSVKYPGDGDVWTAGESNPVAKLPMGSRYLPGEDNGYAGRADFYQLTYGPYLIAVNSSKTKTFDVAIAASGKVVRELVSGKILPKGTSSLSVFPGQAIVLTSDKR